jgi:hypothetical protein
MVGSCKCCMVQTSLSEMVRSSKCFMVQTSVSEMVRSCTCFTVQAFLSEMMRSCKYFVVQTSLSEMVRSCKCFLHVSNSPMWICNWMNVVDVKSGTSYTIYRYLIYLKQKLSSVLSFKNFSGHINILLKNVLSVPYRWREMVLAQSWLLFPNHVCRWFSVQFNTVFK